MTTHNAKEATMRNNFADPIITVGSYPMSFEAERGIRPGTGSTGGAGGCSPYDTETAVPEFLRIMAREGHVILTDNRHYRSGSHYVVGIGIGHDDASFCERGLSFAAYLENGQAFGGRWWESESALRSYRRACAVQFDA